MRSNGMPQRKLIVGRPRSGQTLSILINPGETRLCVEVESAFPGPYDAEIWPDEASRLVSGEQVRAGSAPLQAAGGTEATADSSPASSLTRKMPYTITTAEGSMRLLFIILLSIAGFTQAGGQVNVWIPRGPEGGRIGRLAIDPRNPGTIYASAGARLYQTTDAAGHWNDLGVPSVTILAVDPRNSATLYGANNNTLYKSTDRGLTWSMPGPGLPGSCGPLSFSFVIDPSNTSTLYAGCTGTNSNGGGGLFKSTDSGATWNATSSGLPAVKASPNEPWPPNVSVNALAIDPAQTRRPGEVARRQTLTHQGTLYAVIGATVSYGGGLFRSTDGAASWNAVNSGLPDSLFIDAVAVDQQNPNTLYVAGSTGVFRSKDGAASWTRAGNVINVSNLAIDPLDSGSVYAVNDRGILKSTDGGGSWSVVSPGGTASDPYPWLVGWVVVAPGEGGPSAVYAGGNARGVFKSLDGGSTWTLAKSGLFATSIDSLAIDPRNPHTVYIGVDVAGLYRSTDGTASWSAAPILSGVSFFALANDLQGAVYAQAPNRLYKSNDGGASWVQLPVAPGFTDLAGSTFPPAVDTRNPGTIYAGGFKSTDGGASWSNLALGPTALAIDPQDSGTLYAGTIVSIPGELSVLSVSCGVRKSVDGGRSWSGMNAISQSYGISGLTVDPANSSVVYAQTGKLDCSESYDCNSDYGDPNSDETKKGLGLFRSADGGATWAKLDLPGDPFEFYLVGVDPQGRLYAGATAGLVRSIDGGATWHALPTAGLSPVVSVLAFDPQNPNHLFAGTAGGGVFEITLEQNE